MFVGRSVVRRGRNFLGISIGYFRSSMAEKSSPASTPPSSPSPSSSPSTSPSSRAERIKQQKEKFASMPLDEKRQLYRAAKYYTLDDIEKWSDLARIKYLKSSDQPIYPKNDALNEKLSVFLGDITQLEIDAIVNAANPSLLGGGGVDGAIHRAAGPELKEECRELDGCETGNAKLTCGYKLPARFIIHTVGPVGEYPKALARCYTRSVEICKENSIRSVAFPCISTGIYGYPNEPAAVVVLKTIRDWLDKTENADSIDRIIFCLFLDIDKAIYAKYLPEYFPVL